MKRTRPLWIVFILCIVGVMLVGCGTKEPAWDTFEGALNEKGFPVPKEANSTDRTTSNVAMDYVRYSMPDLKEKEGVPEPYRKAIEAWGWEEQKEEDSTNSRVYQKDGVIVHLTVHNGYFIVMIPKEKKASIKGLKTK
ncbi:hypothetical protein A3844_19970 [Paenibacillus helianthi]|uniref:Lipoprotein n=1 Tax=Paenibacillus helianthi TaxID=1349432 RepID=A0ABX3EJB7_9BACL|nr:MULTISPECIES: hypothetical protein [Paenibacillus]OKP76911.1 hypothetical protein A3842_16900 [Paenibacillus sp. P3E]OKP84092.1 hypothetical protein A3844_19970 [Paenibacillus helianthi]OKP86946.1 hypothetical protein A3848_20780 [Paenibacillus sp. P32E]